MLQATLDGRERNLLRVAAKSMSRAVGLYAREFGGAEGVEAEVERIKLKVQGRLADRVDQRVRLGIAEEPIEVKLIQQLNPDADDGWGGVPVKSVPPGTLAAADAGVARPAATNRRGDPPTRPASAAPRADPSRSVFAGDAPKPARKAAVRQLAPAIAERRRRCTNLLGAQRMTTKAISVALGLPMHSANSLLEGMRRAGIVERTEVFAFDWPGARPGTKPSRVWRLVVEPEGCVPYADDVRGSELEGGGYR